MNEIRTTGLIKEYRGRRVVDDVSINVVKVRLLVYWGQMVQVKQQHFI